MPRGTKILTDVTKDECDLIVKRQRKKGAEVTVEKQPNGNYTITAVFPDKTANSRDTKRNERGQKPKSEGKTKGGRQGGGKKPKSGGPKKGAK